MCESRLSGAIYPLLLLQLAMRRLSLTRLPRNARSLVLARARSSRQSTRWLADGNHYFGSSLSRRPTMNRLSLSLSLSLSVSLSESRESAAVASLLESTYDLDCISARSFAIYVRRRSRLAQRSQQSLDGAHGFPVRANCALLLGQQRFVALAELLQAVFDKKIVHTESESIGCSISTD